MKELKLSASSDLPIAENSYVYSVISTAPRQDLKLDTFQPLSSPDRLVAITSDNSLLTLNPETLRVIPDGHIRNASANLTCLRPFASVGRPCDVVLTAGRDGIVQGWDLRSQKSVFSVSAPRGSRDLLSALDCNFETSSIAAGTELEGNGPGDVSIFIWDTRNPKEHRLAYTESHTDTITELRYLPYPSSASTVLLSGSTDGLVNVFDTTITDEDDAVLQVSNHYSAVHHAGLIGDDIYALGTDEKLSFYVQQSPVLEQQDPDPFVLGDLRDKLQCDYAIKIWNSSQPLLAVGSHNADEGVLRFVPLSRSPSSESPSPQWTLHEDGGFVLPRAHGEEIVRDFYMANDASLIFTCGEDGSIKQWTSCEEDVEMTDTSSSKRKTERSTDRKDKRKRLRP